PVNEQAVRCARCTSRDLPLAARRRGHPLGSHGHEYVRRDSLHSPRNLSKPPRYPPRHISASSTRRSPRPPSQAPPPVLPLPPAPPPLPRPLPRRGPFGAAI